MSSQRKGDRGTGPPVAWGREAGRAGVTGGGMEATEGGAGPAGAGPGRGSGEEAAGKAPLRPASPGASSDFLCFSHRVCRLSLQKDSGDPVPGGLHHGAGGALWIGLRHSPLALAAAGRVPAHLPLPALLLVTRPRAQPGLRTASRSKSCHSRGQAQGDRGPTLTSATTQATFQGATVSLGRVPWRLCSWAVPVLPDGPDGSRSCLRQSLFKCTP